MRAIGGPGGKSTCTEIVQVHLVCLLLLAGSRQWRASCCSGSVGNCSFQAGVSSDSRCSMQGGLQGRGGLLGRRSCDSLPSGLRSCGSACAHCLTAVLGACTERPAALWSNTWAGHALHTPLSPHLHAALLLLFAGAAYTYRSGLHATLPPLVRPPSGAGKLRHSPLRSSPGACEAGRPCCARSVTTQGSRAVRRQASAGPPRAL